LKGSVDRLTVLDSVIVAVGWCEDDSPEVFIDGQPVAQQTCLRYNRPDVDQYLGTGILGKYGFRIAGFVPEQADCSKSSVQVSDGSVLKATHAIPEDRVNELYGRFVKEVSTASENSSLIELGSRVRSGISYKSRFPTISKYTGVDLVAGDGVDVIADLHVLSQTVKSQYDFAFSVSVFEHLLMPWVAAVELNSVLVEGGMAYIQSHPSWPLHDEPWDFFRFSKDAWHGIFSALTGFEVLDTAYGLEATIVPVSTLETEYDLDPEFVLVSPNSGALQGLDTQRTFLVSACLIKKVSEPRVDWKCDPSEIFNLAYGY